MGSQDPHGSGCDRQDRQALAEPGAAGQRQEHLERSQMSEPAATVPVITIRRARADEAQALTDLSLRSKAVWGYDASFLARCRAAMTLMPEKLRAHPFYVATDDTGRLLGYYGFEPEVVGIGVDM